MKKCLMTVLFMLLLCVAAACGKGKAKEEASEITLSLPDSSTSTAFETTTKVHFDWEDSLVREDGYIEVKGESRNTENGDTEIYRLLYAPDGTQVGSRRIRAEETYGTYEWYDDIYMLDTTWESYLAGLTGVDRAKDGRIEYEDGRYEKVQLDGYRILSIESYTEDDQLYSEVTFNEYGHVKRMIKCDEDGTEWLNIRNTYEEITVTR